MMPTDLDDMGPDDRFLVMRNVARRFYKRWSLINDETHGWCWRQTVGGRVALEPTLPGEVEAVRILDEMG